MRDAAARAGRLLRLVEHVWLGPESLPLADRIAEWGWEADGEEVYCDRCGRDVGPSEASEFGCAACRGGPTAWDGAVRLGRYEPPMDAWVREVKFARGERLGRDLGVVLGGRVAKRFGGLWEREPVAVVPVATTRLRRATRGIDHAGAIAAGVAVGLGRAGVEARVVRALRRVHRPSQRAVPTGERAANVRGAFRRVVGLDGRWAVLVDDVSTTGATLASAARALRAGRRGAGKPMGVAAAVLAMTPEPGRSGRGRASEAGAGAG